MNALPPGQRVLVTGAGGFVGANLTRRLLADGHQVHVLLPPGATSWRLEDVIGDAVTWVCDLQDAEAVDRVVRGSRPEYVFHLAAHGAYPSQRSVERMFGTNVMGAVSLVEASLRHGVAAVVNTGSSSEYGYKDHAPREDEWADPNSHYAVTKASATMYCRYASVTSGTPITTLRLYSVYGPYEEPSRLVPALAVHGLEGRLPPLVGPHVARDFIHVHDVVEACLRAAACPDVGAVYNVGTGRQTSLQALVEIVRRRLDISMAPSWGSLPARIWDTDVWVAQPDALQEGTGWVPQVEVEEGFARFVEWLRQDERRLRRYQAAHDPPAPAPGQHALLRPAAGSGST